LWELWSPNYRFDDIEYEKTAKSFDNLDFVEVSIHSYRHRYGAAQGDPAFEQIEVELARQPVATVPTIVLHGESDGISPPQSSERQERFLPARTNDASCLLLDISSLARHPKRWCKQFASLARDEDNRVVRATPASLRRERPCFVWLRPDHWVNQVWCADVTYIPMAKGFLYLVVIMDWASRAVLAWRLSNTLGADFCVEALEEALARYGRPEIFNTDQSSQFTSDDFTGTLKDHGITISMDGKSLPSRKRGVSVGHGVSLLQWRSGGENTPTTRRPSTPSFRRTTSSTASWPRCV
jgi:hypothetical protein